MRNRRTFLAASCALTASMLATTPSIALSGDPLKNLLVINALGFPEDPYAPHGAEIASEGAIQAIKASGLTAINVTLTSGNDFPATLKALDDFDAFIAAHTAQIVSVGSVDDIRRAKTEGKTGFIYGFQNAAMIDQQLDRLDLFARRNVKIIQLTYNSPNQIGGGSLAPGNPGLSAFGREAVDRLNQLKLMVDLSHSGQKTCLEAARISKQPISINHTGCAALAPNPRNKTDEELRLVADRGGFIGIYFMPYLTPGRPFTSDDVVDHLDHALKVCGEDHVGIGTDHGVNDLGATDAVKAHYAQMVNARRREGISAPGEDPEILPFGKDLIGSDQFQVLFRRMDQRGYSPTRIEKILGLNFLKYAKEIWS